MTLNLLDMARLDSGILVPSTFRNKLINGNFGIWQRGTSRSDNGFLADRFRNSAVGSSQVVSRQAFANGQTEVPGNPVYFQRHVVTSVAGAANFAITIQAIEDVRLLSGTTVTASFWAKADAPRYLSFELTQDFGPGGSPSPTVLGIGATRLQLSTAWQKYTVTATLPSVAGKTLGTSYSLTNAVWWFDGGSNYTSRNGNLPQQSGTFDLANLQIEEGTVATPFEVRPFGIETALCQRYYCKTYNIDTPPGTQTFDGSMYSLSVGGNLYFNWEFPVEMRTKPATVVAFRPDVVNTTGATHANPSAVAVSYSYGSTRRMVFTGVGATAGNGYLVQAVADAEIV